MRPAHPADGPAMPERLADIAEIVRVELAECLDTHLAQMPWRRRPESSTPSSR